MSSARKRGAIQKANNETDRLRQQLILSEYHASLFRGIAEGLAKDVARYRWLRQEHEVLSPLARCSWKMFDNRESGNWANVGDGADLDRLIDSQLESYNAIYK